MRNRSRLTSIACAALSTALLAACSSSLPTLTPPSVAPLSASPKNVTLVAFQRIGGAPPPAEVDVCGGVQPIQTVAGPTDNSVTISTSPAGTSGNRCTREYLQPNHVGNGSVTFADANGNQVVVTYAVNPGE